MFGVDRDWLRAKAKPRKSWTGNVQSRSLYGLPIHIADYVPVGGNKKEFLADRTLRSARHGKQRKHIYERGPHRHEMTKTPQGSATAEEDTQTGINMRQSSYASSIDSESLTTSILDDLLPLPQISRSLSVITRPAELGTTSAAELKLWHQAMRAVELFHDKTKPALRVFNSAANRLFGDIVPQLLMEDSVIFLQVIATTLALDARFGWSPDSSNSIALSRIYHTYALRRLSKICDPPSTSTILLCCLLIIATDMAQHCAQTAYLHLESGLRVLRQDKEIRRAQLRPSDPHNTNAISMGYIEAIFAQLEATAGYRSFHVAKSSILLDWGRPTIPDHFADFREAHEKFFELTQWAHFNDPSVMPCTSATENGFETPELWQRWHKTFRKYIRGLPDRSSREHRRARLLEAHYRRYCIAWQCQRPSTEMLWDGFVEEHKAQLTICREVIYSDETYAAVKGNHNKSPVSNFELSPGVTPPLWEIVISCRESAVRREALRLLKVHHQRCGHDDQCHSVVVTGTIMLLEEQASSMNEVPTCSDIPEKKRVRLLAVNISQPGIVEVTFTRFPYVQRETMAVPIESKHIGPAMLLTFWPIGASTRLSGYQGLVRLHSNTCMCKVNGATS